MTPLHPQLAPICQQLEQQLLGKPHVVRLALSCLLASGHLLIEDLPGAGKTSLAKWLAAGFGLSFQRIQFTSDLLPADIIGVSVFEPPTQQFKFHPGPIFHQLVLADELNRASPRTQSALLEAMEENQVSTDGQSYALDTPFFVIATQNPREQLGTFDLPESQLDRFAMRLSIGFPDLAAEMAMLKRSTAHQRPKNLLDTQALQDLQQAAEHLHCSDALLEYLLRLIHASRKLEGANPLSPRCSLSLVACAKAWALVHNKQHVSPEDVQAVFSAVSAHRLGTGDSGLAYAKQLLDSVDPYQDLK